MIVLCFHVTLFPFDYGKKNNLHGIRYMKKNNFERTFLIGLENIFFNSPIYLSIRWTVKSQGPETINITKSTFFSSFAPKKNQPVSLKWNLSDLISLCTTQPLLFQNQRRVESNGLLPLDFPSKPFYRDFPLNMQSSLRNTLKDPDWEPHFQKAQTLLHLSVDTSLYALKTHCS